MKKEERLSKWEELRSRYNFAGRSEFYSACEEVYRLGWMDGQDAILQMSSREQSDLKDSQCQQVQK